MSLLLEIENYDKTQDTKLKMLLTYATQETTLARHLAKSQQDACAHKILLDGRFEKIQQEHLSRTCKINQDQCLAKYCKNEQDHDFARLSKIMIAKD